MAPGEDKTRIDLAAMVSPMLLAGDATTAYRDPAAIYHDGTFYLYFTIGKIEPDKSITGTPLWAKSQDLTHWTDPKIFTPRDQTKNFASPGCVVRGGENWAVCLQTYPSPSGRGYGDPTARIWTVRSRNLEDWGLPELLRVSASGGCRNKRPKSGVSRVPANVPREQAGTGVMLPPPARVVPAPHLSNVF